MHFNLTEEQQLIKSSIEKFTQDQYDFETRRKMVNTEQGWSKENWAMFAELGWLSLPFPEKFGGFDGTIIDSIVIMEAFGKALVAEPFLASVGLGGSALVKSDAEDLKAELLPSVIGGELILALAYDERNARSNIELISANAEKSGQGYVINGEKIAVINGQDADKLVVAAKSNDSGDLQLFLVDPKATGVELVAYKSIDGGKAANIKFTDVQVEESALLNPQTSGAAILQSVIDEATIMVCAEAVGAMEVLLKDTVEYTKTRKQFGLPIGKFQVLQHRMSDMFIELEQTRSLLLMAAIKWRDQDEEAGRMVSALKAKVGSAGRAVGQQAVQLHGGIGMTDELNIGHFFKRLTIIDALFGNRDFHLNRMMK